MCTRPSKMLLMTSAEVVSVARLGSKLGGSVLTFIFSTLPSASSPPQPATTLAPGTNTTIKITPSHTCLHLFKIIPPLYQVPERLSLIHISEPTRLRRISYAVFCLKKKK